MKKCILIPTILCLIWVTHIGGLRAQDVPEHEVMPAQAAHLDSLYAQMPALELNSPAFANVKRLKLSEAERNIPLPSSVNNSLQPWMIPVFYQSALECGQASTICYTLSYELMRKRGDPYAVGGLNYAYPSHFAWNFCNKGTNDGVSFLDSWEVIRTAGTPNVMEWGGWYSTGGGERWISGYETYHSAMKNRISEMYAIPIDDEDGLLTLKHWLNDHLAGESSGGLANFYCSYTTNVYTIPSNSPEAGKHIIYHFSGYVNHSMTIVGYNDDVRWDYNNDGQYTNNLDITGDGIVDLKDWEIGAVLVCNTYGENFGDNGFCYIPYCKLASLHSEGGIWNKCVYVVQVRDEVFPQITFKATITHPCREMLKLTAGIANDTNATRPEKTLEFNVFNRQGGCRYMQGGTTVESNKTLELGLDVSPLLNYVEPGQPCKFFLIASSISDMYHNSEGVVQNFSLMDYTSGTEVEHACPSTNVALMPGDTLWLSVVRAINFSKPVIQNTLLPDMEVDSNYQQTLHAIGGKPPYHWELNRKYKIEEINVPFPTESGQDVPLSNANNGYATVELPFTFPCYGDEYNRIVVYADGYITFHHQSGDWPFLATINSQGPAMQEMAIRAICPFKANLTNCTVRKIVGSDNLTLVFHAEINGTVQNVNFAVRLDSTGIIDFIYGNMVFQGNSFWSALVRGDNQLIQHTPVSGHFAADINHRCYRFTPSSLPEGLTLSSDGVLSGKVDYTFEDATFAVTCHDNNDVQTTRDIHLSCRAISRVLLSDITVNGKSDPYIYAGDTLFFDISLLNADTIPYHNSTILVQSDDPFVTFLDSIESLGDIVPGEPRTFSRCAACIVHRNIPDNHPIPFSIHLNNHTSAANISRTYTAHRYDIALLQHAFLSANDIIPHPDETDTLVLTLQNNKAPIYDVDLYLRTPQTGVTLSSSQWHFDTITYFSFQISSLLDLSPAFVDGTTFNVYLDIYVKGIFLETKTITLTSEKFCFDFENGSIPAPFHGDGIHSNWNIDSIDHFATHCSTRLCCGQLNDFDTATLQMDVHTLQSTQLSFYLWTMLFLNIDYCYIYVDDILQRTWTGSSWGDSIQVRLTIPAGDHTITWNVVKGNFGNVNEVNHRVWIDNICLTEFNDDNFDLDILPDSVEVSLGANTCTTDSALVNLESHHSGIVLFNNVIEYEDGNAPHWVSCAPDNDFIDANGQRQVVLYFNSFGCLEEDYHATLRIRHTGGEQLIPVTMHVSSVGIPTVEQSRELKVYPNPTYGSVTVQHESTLIERVTVTDLYGRTVAIIHVNDYQGNLNLSGLPAGVYLLNIEFENKDIVTTKLLRY